MDSQHSPRFLPSMAAIAGCRRAARGAVGKRADPRAHPHRSRLAAGAGRIRAAAARTAAAPNRAASSPPAWRSSPATTRRRRSRPSRARINHDVKAVEYFVRDEISAAGATPAQLELVHFGCTSEDINNLAYARMLRAARTRALAELEKLIEALRGFAHEHAALPMLARTHGQTASPPRWARNSPTSSRACGARARASTRWRSSASGTARWATTTRMWPRCPRSTGPRSVAALRRVAGLHLERIHHADRAARLDRRILRRAGRHQHHPHRLCRDTWGYISLGYLRQRAVAGEVGSSTMPHKVNPIDFENAEGNLGIANALLHHFAEQAADLALAARPHRLHGAAQRRRGAGAQPHRVECAAARPRQDRRRTRRPSRPTSMARTKCSARRCRPRCAPPACRTATSCSRISRAARDVDARRSRGVHRQTTAAAGRSRAAQGTDAGRNTSGLAARHGARLSKGPSRTYRFPLMLRARPCA